MIVLIGTLALVAEDYTDDKGLNFIEIIVIGFFVVGVPLMIWANWFGKRVKCPRCKERAIREHGLQRSEYLGYQDGYHYETRTATTQTQHFGFDNSREGHSESTTSYQVEVPHRDHYYRDYFKCPTCSYLWSAQRTC